MSKARDAERQRRRKSKAIEMIAEMSDSGFARNPNRPKAANIAPEYSGGLGGYIAADPVSAAKGFAVAPFTAAPDILGLLASAGNYGVTRGAEWLTGAEKGTFSGFKPFGQISGDPIREMIGLDPSSGPGMVGEAAFPFETIAKAPSAIAKLMMSLADTKSLMAAAPLGFVTNPLTDAGEWFRGSKHQDVRLNPSTGLLHLSSDEMTAARFGPTTTYQVKDGKYFDPDNEEHLQKLKDAFASDEALNRFADSLDKIHHGERRWLGSYDIADYFNEGAEMGVYQVLESPEVVKWMREQGYDGAFMREDDYGPIGLALFDTDKIAKPSGPTEVGAMLADAPLKAVESTIDAERRFSDGETIFAVHEMDEQPSLVESLDQLKSYSYDQLYTAGKPKPLTRKEFYDSFDMHTDLRGREGGADQNYESIMEGGFRQGTFNRLPAAMAEGGPGMGGQYAPKPGDYVYLIPSSVEGKSAGGRPSMPQGWRPGGDDGGIMVQIREGEDLYDAYARTIKGTGPTEVGAMLADAPLPTSAARPAAANLNRADFIYDPEIPPAPAGSRSMAEIGQDFNRDALEAWGGKPMAETPENAKILAENLTAEAEAAYRARPEMAGWYKHNLEEAMGYAAEIHPELATDPQAQMAFKVILAITSNGQRVPLNAKVTEDVYRQWKATGEFPIFGTGKEADAMARSFETANRLISERGFDDFAAFLSRDFTVRELKNAGFNVGGESLDAVVKGSSIFGPKIGGGFMQNLLGNFDPPTFDRWFQRTYGRHTGTLIANEQKFGDQVAEFLNAVEDLDPDELRAFGLTKDKLEWVNQEPEAAAQLIYNAFEKGKFKHKTELNNAARNLVKSITGLVDAPAGSGQRDFMRGVMIDVRDQLRSRGIQVDTADVQALLWYAEKDLYKKLGGTVNMRRDDYASSFKRIAEQARTRPR